MIGLGSNRLSVCRRGGMSVTQAGRGGMEWLAGDGLRGRSPYSDLATAALKAQFPTQWPTILDYGFAHPEIVGYMNAYAPEDAKIAYSLVPTLGVIRWLTSSGGALIDTGYKPQADKIHLKTKLQIHGPVKSGTQFVAYGFYNGSRVPISFYCPGGVANTMTVYHEVANVLGTSASSFTFAKNETVDIEVTVENNSRTVTQNGVTKTQSFTGSLGNNLPIILFGSRTTSGYYMEVASSFSDTILDDLHLVPFIHDDNGTKVNGFLDLPTGDFYPNAGSGSFTISETPVS